MSHGSGVDEGPQIDEATLLARVRDGDHDAYAAVVRRHSAMAIRTAAMLGAGTDAEDVAQEAFVKAYRALGRFRPGAPFRPWLLAIVANEARNLHRTVRRRSDRELRPLADVPTDGPAEALEIRERQQLVRRALDALPADQREVLVCRYLLELDERETATVLGLSPGTVKSRTSRGLRRLRTGLTADVGAQEVGHGR